MKTNIPMSPPSKPPPSLAKIKKREFLPPLSSLSHEKLDMQNHVGNEQVSN